MAAADRVTKFNDDSLLVITQSQTKSNNTKLLAEISKLKTWIQKHQDETLPDGHKGKLLQTLENYNRYVNTPGTIFEKEKVLDVVLDLLSDYLQLPEGWLLTATYKKKVMNWREILLAAANESTPTASSTSSSSGHITRWSVEGIESKGQKITLLNVDNQELWKEDFIVKDKVMFQTIQTHSTEAGESGKIVIVEVDERTQIVLSCQVSE